MQSLTPQEIVAELDRYIVGQERAKKSVAVALRNRWRRRQLPDELAQDVYPKNTLLIGPTGVGKTEIARRLAGLAKAPFLKVEASKYSEVGYHGRDVESMIRDLAEVSVRMVQAERNQAVREKALTATRERILEALYRQEEVEDFGDDMGMAEPGHIQFVQDGGLWRPIVTGPEGELQEAEFEDPEQLAQQEEQRQKREALAQSYDNGELEDFVLEIEVLDRNNPVLSVMGPQGTDAMGIDAGALQELWGRGGGPRTKRRRLKIQEVRALLLDEEAQKLVDEDDVHQEALRRAEQDGILFIDEIDKVVGAGSGSGPDVSREGVQRDLLTVVEGCTVYTKFGYIKTDHILFVAAGAFHFHKPSELIPELQGRFPVRVALQDLSEDDFTKILTEPQNSLTKQYRELLRTEGVELSFTEDGLAELAKVAFKANKTTQNIGARRLMTTMEMLLEEVSFEASENPGSTCVVDAAFVQKRLGAQADDPDLIRYMI
ncbi:MAG: HslU--HslV peptidase ATPase subunit [Planctomycetota bacterium]|nr:MAG: HslU--HslV peptidase ATPase subunit [Planctomycetota bacterium]